MLLQAVLIALLFLLLVIVAIIKYRKDAHGCFVYNSNFNNKKSAQLYAPFNEIFYTVDNYKKANVIFFQDYGNIDNNINKLLYPPGADIYAIAGSDLMASKSALAQHFDGTDYIPKSYNLGEVEKKGVYILKKNIQRQQGNLITTDLDYINNKAADDGYVIAQELLQDVFLVNGRKINMRVYLLIETQGLDIKFYIYNNGFMYYTPELFEKGSLEEAKNITTGYIDRKVYEENPLTHQDFYDWLGEDKSQILRDNMMRFFRAFKDVYGARLLELNKNIPGKKFNTFGVDIAPDGALGVKIMEVNKAPDLSYKDKRDGALKLGMVKAMFSDKKGFLPII